MFAGKFTRNVCELAALMFYILLAFSHAFNYIHNRMPEQSEDRSDMEDGVSDFNDFSTPLRSMYTLFFAMLGNVNIEVFVSALLI